jgi:uncharacterized membrane protein YeaQ/YmgE (transglycosylase-associated protein family)
VALQWSIVVAIIGTAILLVLSRAHRKRTRQAL